MVHAQARTWRRRQERKRGRFTNSCGPWQLLACSRSIPIDASRWRQWASTSLRSGKLAARLAELIGRPYIRQSWSALEDTVRTGETAFRQLNGTIFDAAMTGLSRMAAHAVADAYDFSDSTCVVDVGGGQGALLAEILSRHAQLKGILSICPASSRAHDQYWKKLV